MAISAPSAPNSLFQLFQPARTIKLECLFICWAAQTALQHFYRIPKCALQRKAFGVFEQQLLKFGSPSLEGMGAQFLLLNPDWRLVHPAPPPLDRHIAHAPSQRAGADQQTELIHLLLCGCCSLPAAEGSSRAYQPGALPSPPFPDRDLLQIWRYSPQQFHILRQITKGAAQLAGFQFSSVALSRRICP